MAEHTGVAALQAHHLPTGAHLLDQQLVDRGLRQDMAIRPFADEAQLGVGRRFVQQRGRDQAIVEDQVGLAQHVQATDGD